MDEPGKLLSLSQARWLKLSGIVIALVIFTVQRFTGNEYTHLLVLLYCLFLLPAIALDRAVQERYFPYIQPFIAALRAVTIVVTVMMLALYLYAMMTPLGDPITLPEHLRYPGELQPSD
ncbi:hypothetical protein [Shewanella sp. GXUN23E]|uniref:hypothetical protein n=1 Tax=Shewanella sp. GXUN23E TaxID=3422498 RepID=UPI003D7D95CF